MKLLVIKTGDTYDHIKKTKGDFEDWILNSMDMVRSACMIVDLPSGHTLPSLDEVAGAVITGSHDMVTDRLEWSENAVPWLQTAVVRKVPILGICYGHQLLAYALGGIIGDNPTGREFGNTDVYLTKSGKSDPLFKNIPESMKVHVCHKQSVTSLPETARHLAWNEAEKHHGFVVGENVWGLQFHPEFDAEITINYIQSFRDELTFEGQDPDNLIADCRDTPIGPTILKNFASIVFRS